MAGILIAGTSSDAGKSAVVTGICRALRRRGVDVAPFKAQNMSNNSMVCADGAEIGRAQYLQAQAAGVEPSSLLNPVLLKPGSDRQSFVVLRGRPAGTLVAGEYATGRRHLAEAAYAAYAELAARHELVIVEGAGSPAEINLRGGDYVNMGLARQFDLPVVIVGDIDRGGVLASLYGTWGLLEPADRRLLAGYVINKFRGDQAVLDPGLRELSARTGLQNFGVLPWLRGVWLDGEDALQVDRWRAELGPVEPGSQTLRVAVLRFPRISNATDVEALAHTPGADVQLTADPAVAAAADLLVLPGSRATVSDLGWLRDQGLAEVIAARHAAGRPILGICGGYQMLADAIEDDFETAAGRVPGLGVLPVQVRFAAEKITAQATHHWQGHRVDGYEIHHGICTPDGPGEPFLDGWRQGFSFGTMLHGSLENDGFRVALLEQVAAQTGSGWRPKADAIGYAAARETMIETLADAVDAHVDLDAILATLREADTSSEPPSLVGGAGLKARSSHLNQRTSATHNSEPHLNHRTSDPDIAEPHLDQRRTDTVLEVRAPASLERTSDDPAAERPAHPRAQPLLIVHTGSGKGKSTAAFGMGLRAWAQGWSIGVYQFIKAATWPTGERAAYQVLAAERDRGGPGGRIEWHTLGQGRTQTRAGQRADQRGLAAEGWALLRDDLAAQRHDLYILDEFNHVLAKGWLDLAEVIQTLRERPGQQHVVITGRNAPAELIEIADLVSDVTKISHPFDQGLKGQPGIEW